MHKAICASIVAAGLLVAQQGRAQDPSLVGTWSGTDFIGKTWGGTTMSMDSFKSVELEIREHDGPTISGVIRWELTTDEHGLHDGEQVTTRAEEVVLGVRDFDGTYVIVEHPDMSIRRCRLIDENTLEVVGYEGGPNAYVARAVYKRQ